MKNLFCDFTCTGSMNDKHTTLQFYKRFFKDVFFVKSIYWLHLHLRFDSRYFIFDPNDTLTEFLFMKLIINITRKTKLSKTVLTQN